MIKKILVANRGEIAVRIMQACRELGIAAVAVYSDADRDALHVRSADEVQYLGPSPAPLSYLNLPAMLAAARRCGADAIHPGYGFLSENPEFAEACAAAGVVFIGPPAAAMRAMGDKRAAKRLAADLHVPVVPGHLEEANDPRRLEEEAERLGYPLLVKAAGGGGGRGMRIVTQAGQLSEALASAGREATGAFGDGRLLLERYLLHPRHIEMQVLGDTAGRVAVLGERECSVQRRHQKVIEEAPAPGLDPEVRQAMAGAAARLAGAVGYVNAGTVEFLLDRGGGFFFLEMNTRLQVEHGVTELVTGIDLVRQQILIAQGEPLSIATKDIAPRGHAIECRIYAEDPARHFAPSPGRLLVFEPPQGPGIRNDLGVYPGAEVSQHYDPLLAKLLIHGGSRDEAVRRLGRSLDRYLIGGITTNLPLLRSIARHPDFQAGRVSTQFLEEQVLPTMAASGDTPVPWEVFAAAAGMETLSTATLHPHRNAAAVHPWYAAGSWQPGGQRSFAYVVGDAEQQVSVARAGEGSDGSPQWAVRVGEREQQVQWQLTGDGKLLLLTEGRVHAFAVLSGRAAVTVLWQGDAYVLGKPGPARITAANRVPVGRGTRGLTAPMPALVVKVLVREGEPVRPQQTLVVLEAMKMEHLVQSPVTGTARKVHCHEGQNVPEGAVLVEVEGT